MNKTVIEVEETSLSFAKSFLRDARLDLDDIKRKFFIIGFRLNEAQEFNYASALGYADIYELAEEEFGFKKTTTKNLMAINREFCDHEAMGRWLSYTKEIGKGWKNYSQSQLVEMLPLTWNQRRNVPADFKESELKIYKKILAGEVLTAELRELGNPSVTEDPRKYVNLYKESANRLNPGYSAEDHTALMKSLDKFIKPAQKAENADIPREQLYLQDDGSITEYHQSGAPTLPEEPKPKMGKTAILSDCLLSEDERRELEERRAELSSQSTDQGKTDLSKYILSKEEMAERSKELLEMEKQPRPKLHLFKNRKEREDFILNSANYTVTVLENEELQLKVRRLDLANGAKIYRTDWSSYNDYKKKIEEGYTLHLVDGSNRDMPKVAACCSDLSAKCYTLPGTFRNFIIDYMTMYRDEI